MTRLDECARSYLSRRDGARSGNRARLMRVEQERAFGQRACPECALAAARLFPSSPIHFLFTAANHSLPSTPASASNFHSTPGIALPAKHTSLTISPSPPKPSERVPPAPTCLQTATQRTLLRARACHVVPPHRRHLPSLRNSSTATKTTGRRVSVLSVSRRPRGAW